MAKTNVISKKKFTCFLCKKVRVGNIDKTKMSICSTCVERLRNTPNEKRKQIVEELRIKGFIEKAEIVEKWLHEEMEDKDEKFQRIVDREGSNRQVRASEQKRKKRKNR